MKEVVVNSYYIDKEKYKKELEDQKELQKETRKILKILFNENQIDYEEYCRRLELTYRNNNKNESVNRSMRDVLDSEYDRNCYYGIEIKSSLEIYNNSKMFSNEIKNIINEINYIIETNDISILDKYSEEIQQEILLFIEDGYDPYEIRDYLDEKGISLSKERTR